MKITIADFDELQTAIKEYAGNAEEAINDVLHNQGGELIQNSIRNLIPVSGRTWKGKAPAAKKGKSLTSVNSNLAVKVTNTPKYGYLYFADDGSNTKNHAGNKQFFAEGGEAVKDEIIERMISRLVVL